jgi:SET family sugar efflux transporter-like MFS transporter
VPRPGEPGAETGPSQILRATRRLLQQRDLRVVLASSAVLGLAVSFVLPFLSMFGTLEAKMSLPVFGAFMTVSALGSIVLSTALAQRSDLLSSRRSMLLLGSGSGALGYLATAFTRDIWLLVLIFTVVLGVASITFSQLFAHARELLEGTEIPKHEAPLYMNTFRMCFALSWTVGPALAAATLRRWSFTGLFSGAGSLYLLLFLIILLFVPARAQHAPASPSASAALEPRSPEKPASSIWNRHLLGWFVAFVFVFAAHAMSMSNMSLLVLKVLGGSESQVGIIFSLAPLFELPFMLYFGLLATRVDSTRLIRLAIGIAIVYYAALAHVKTPTQIYPLQFLSAAIVSVTSGVAITFFQNKAPGRFGAATNLYSNASRVGSTSGYLIFGSVAGSVGHRGVYLVCSALVALAFALGSLSERSRPARASEPVAIG